MSMKRYGPVWVSMSHLNVVGAAINLFLLNVILKLKLSIVLVEGTINETMTYLVLSGKII